jgi:hypothetical protein
LKFYPEILAIGREAPVASLNNLLRNPVYMIKEKFQMSIPARISRSPARNAKVEPIPWPRGGEGATTKDAVSGCRQGSGVNNRHLPSQMAIVDSGEKPALPLKSILLGRTKQEIKF